MRADTKTQLQQRLRRFLPDEAVLAAAEDLAPYECDGLPLFRQKPAIAVLPAAQAQLLEVLRVCADMEVPVVARGAGTGLSGGATPDPDGVLLCMSKFNRILKLNPAARTAVVEPGVRNIAISQAAAPHGLYYAPDPSSQIVCSIGGNVAENSGGVHCLKYGLTGQNIARVRVATIDGEILDIGSEAPDSSGFDLLALLTGSEGLLGVITEITVKLRPKPESASVVMAAFDCIERAGDAVAAIIAAGIVPAGLEMMDNAAIRAIEAFVPVGYPLEAAAVLLCEADGGPEQVDDEITRLRGTLVACGARSIRVSRNEEERQLWWKGRKSAFPAAGRAAPDYYCMDGTIPRRCLAQTLRRIEELSGHYGLTCVNVFHAGDGNLHPLILFDAGRPGELQRAEAFGAAILRLCLEMGGSITGEHGVGLEKLDLMCMQFGADELECFHGIKRAFDPRSLLNPGKAVPTLHRCAEFGAVRAHAGMLPHPEIPRF